MADEPLLPKAPQPATVVVGSALPPVREGGVVVVADNLLPADSLRSTDPAVPVRLDIPAAGSPADRRPPVSVPSLLAATAREAPDHTAMAVKRDGAWLKWTYQNYLSEVSPLGPLTHP